MVRGFYAAAAGVFSQQKAFNVTSNNIANATTTGYKSQKTVESSFGEHLVSKMSSINNMSDKNIGPGTFMTVNISEHTDFTQGSLENTGRAVDMALNGEGFFLIKSHIYGEVLTRNGQFDIDEDGELILSGVGKVLNENKRSISVESSNFSVSPSGIISEDGDEVDTLYIANRKEGTELKNVGNGVFQSQNGFQHADSENYKILQGTIEKSNINMAKEMSDIIAGQSHYQSCTQILKIFDKINEICVNQIGKIG